MQFCKPKLWCHLREKAGNPSKLVQSLCTYTLLFNVLTGACKVSDIALGVFCSFSQNWIIWSRSECARTSTPVTSSRLEYFLLIFTTTIDAASKFEKDHCRYLFYFALLTQLNAPHQKIARTSAFTEVLTPADDQLPVITWLLVFLIIPMGAVINNKSLEFKEDLLLYHNCN